jgi:TIR domain/SIR2-like domain
VPETGLTEAQRRELRALATRIKEGLCVLVLGPYTSVRPDDPTRTPLEQHLAAAILESIGSAPGGLGGQPPTLRQASEMHYQQRRDREELQLLVQDFYAGETRATTDFHRNLAQLPFRLCVNASPDDLMHTALVEAGKKPQRGRYSFRRPLPHELRVPNAEEPLVYHLFGHWEDPSSLILTEGDLIEYLVKMVQGAPGVPDEVRSVLGDEAKSCLFLGFGFQNWYLRVLLQVLKLTGHHSKALAFEDPHFFELPEHQQAVGFFSGQRLIDFRRLDWESLPRLLREACGTPSRPVVTNPVPVREDAPTIFLSYASEDREWVDQLADALQMRGFAFWKDRQNLRVGDRWSRVLEDVISSKVDYVVVVQTEQMALRINGVFHSEIEVALRKQSEMGEFEGQRLRFLLPVKIGECPTLSSLASFHVVTLSGPADVGALASSIEEDWKRRGRLKTLREKRVA